MGIKLNPKYKDGFLSQLEASQRGEVIFIPVGLQRLGSVFNLMQSRYTLISGATGAGKTSFADYLYVLKPWDFLKTAPKDIHWEVIYFSLERKQMFKHAKWISYFIYRDHGILVSPDALMGWSDEGAINKAAYDMIRSYDMEISKLLEHVRIYDSKVGTGVVRRAIEARAIDLGTFYYTDGEAAYMLGKTVYVERFDEKNLVESTKMGNRKYVDLNHEGELFRLYEDDHKYFMKNPKTFVFIVIDGIGLLGDKNIIDEISVDIANARDKFGFSPVVITQQNRAMGDIQRMKAHGGDLSPQLEDIFKSSQMGFDADLVLGLFDPYRYKAFDTMGKYEGYSIKPADGNINSASTLTPGGQSRFRSIHVLKNSFGPDGNKFGLKFLGESNHFETLPTPDKVMELEKVYADIRQGI